MHLLACSHFLCVLWSIGETFLPSPLFDLLSYLPPFLCFPSVYPAVGVTADGTFSLLECSGGYFCQWSSEILHFLATLVTYWSALSWIKVPQFHAAIPLCPSQSSALPLDPVLWHATCTVTVGWEGGVAWKTDRRGFDSHLISKGRFLNSGTQSTGAEPVQPCLRSLRQSSSSPSSHRGHSLRNANEELRVSTATPGLDRPWAMLWTPAA